MTFTDNTLLKKLLIVFLVVTGLYLAKGFLIPMVVGGLLATLFLPFCKWMELHRVPRGGAVLICFLAILLVIAALGIVLGWKISEFANDISLIKHESRASMAKLQKYLLQNLGLSMQKQSEILADEQPSLSTVASYFFNSMSEIAASLVLSLVYLVSFLYYRGHLFAFLLKLSKSAKDGELDRVIERITQVSQQYLLGLAKMIFFALDHVWYWF